MTMAYFAPHDDLIDELCAAAKRGVRVRLMLPGRCDVHALIVAARSFYETLLDAGVEIYERQGVVLHAKTMVIDGTWATVGSTNLDNRSLALDEELNVIIFDRGIAGQMERVFLEDVAQSQLVTYTEWKKRGFTAKFLELVAFPIRDLL